MILLKYRDILLKTVLGWAYSFFERIKHELLDHSGMQIFCSGHIGYSFCHFDALDFGGTGIPDTEHAFAFRRAGQADILAQENVLSDYRIR